MQECFLDKIVLKSTVFFIKANMVFQEQVEKSGGDVCKIKKPSRIN